MLSGAQMVQDSPPHGPPPGQGHRFHPQEPLREDAVSIRRVQEQRRCWR